MGYNGLGMQRWIFTMKPRKFLGKRSKPDGGGGESHAGINVQSYYHFEKHLPETPRTKDYPPAYRKKLLKQLVAEKRHQHIIIFLVFLVLLLAIVFLLVYLNHKIHWF